MELTAPNSFGSFPALPNLPTTVPSSLILQYTHVVQQPAARSAARVEAAQMGDISGALISFEVGGHQYLAVGSGGRIAMTTSYSGLTHTYIPLGSRMTWVFA